MQSSSNTMFVKDFINKPTITENTKSDKIQKTCNIYERVRNRQKKIENDMFTIDRRKRKLKELQNEANKQVKRHQIKQKKELEIEIKNLEQEIEEISNGNVLQNFNESIEPYIEKFQKQQFCRPPLQIEANLSDNPKPHPNLNEFTNVIFHEYLMNVENEVPNFDSSQVDICKKCAEPLQLYQTYAIMICPNCGLASQFLDATASLLAFSDDYDYCSFSYKRINHFQEWLASIQAKENMDIPQEILDRIMEQLWQQRIVKEDDITVHRVRDILKNLKERKYYEHVQLITCKITGREPPKMTPEQEECIKNAFMAATQAFQRHCPPDRKNMVSYSYSLLKLCELLGYDHFVPYFMVLKGKEKLSRVENLWRKICEDLDWTYIPSLPS